MAGDGQMDPRDLPTLVEPLDIYDHVKGNRFHHPSGLNNMPIVRRWASRLLSVLTSPRLAGSGTHSVVYCDSSSTIDEVPK